MTEVTTLEIITPAVDETQARLVSQRLETRAEEARKTARAVQVMVVAMVGLVVILLLIFEGLWMPYQQQLTQQTRLDQLQSLRGAEAESLRKQILLIEEQRADLRERLAETKLKNGAAITALNSLLDSAGGQSGTVLIQPAPGHTALVERGSPDWHTKVQSLRAEAATTELRGNQYFEDIKELDASRARLDDLLARRLTSGGDAGQPTATPPKSGKNTEEIFEGIALRIGAVVLVIYLAQVLTSASRYHFRMADRLSGHGLALDFAIAAKNLSLYEPLARGLTADPVGFGKMPATPQDKVMELLKAAIEKFPTGKTGP